MADFYYLYPSKFNNKTNGITHRRWLLKCNPELTNLLKDTIGDGFISHPMDLEKFKTHLNDNNVLERLDKIKQNSRHYAKRQITWFKNKMNCHEVINNDLAFNTICSLIDEFLYKK